MRLSDGERSRWSPGPGGGPRDTSGGASQSASSSVQKLIGSIVRRKGPEIQDHPWTNSSGKSQSQQGMGVKIESKQHTIQDKTKTYALITLLCPLYLTTSSQRYCEDPSHASPKGYINQNEKGRGENYKQKKTKKKGQHTDECKPSYACIDPFLNSHQTPSHCPLPFRPYDRKSCHFQS